MPGDIGLIGIGLVHPVLARWLLDAGYRVIGRHGDGERDNVITIEEIRRRSAA